MLQPTCFGSLGCGFQMPCDRLFRCVFVAGFYSLVYAFVFFQDLREILAPGEDSLPGQIDVLLVRP